MKIRIRHRMGLRHPVLYIHVHKLPFSVIYANVFVQTKTRMFVPSELRENL